jgi:hypothetical protein
MTISKMFRGYGRVRRIVLKGTDRVTGKETFVVKYIPIRIYELGDWAVDRYLEDPSSFDEPKEHRSRW